MSATATATVNEVIVPLRGKPLLQKIKELANMPRREKARRCGYYKIVKGDQVQVNLAEFYDAILEARGTKVDPESSKDGRGREPTYRVTVHQNGQIVIGSTYTQSMGLKPGDEFTIKLGYKHIKLAQVENGSTEADDE